MKPARRWWRASVPIVCSCPTCCASVCGRKANRQMNPSHSQWYVVQTQANAENKAVAHLSRQGYATYLPRYLKRRRHARRVDVVAAPLFPRYLFVEFDMGVQRWRSIYSTIGVSRLVCNGEFPAPV